MQIFSQCKDVPMYSFRQTILMITVLEMQGMYQNTLTLVSIVKKVCEAVDLCNVAVLMLIFNKDIILFSRAPLGIDISKRVEEESIKVPKLKKIRWFAS